FYSSEQSLTLDADSQFKIEFVAANGDAKELKGLAKLKAGEVIDSSVMHVAKLKEFVAQAIQDAKEAGVLLSAYLKVTMMKFSDLIIFGAIVEVYFKDVYEKYDSLCKELRINKNNGLGEVYAKIAGSPQEAEVKAASDAAIANG